MTRYLSLEGASVLLKLPFWVQREVLQVQYYVAADHLSPGICAADCFHACVLSSTQKWVRRHYDLPLEWMDDRFGRNQKRNRDRVAQYFSLPFSDRIKAIKRIRDGGSVPPDYMRALDSHAGAGRLEIKVDSVCAVEAANESVRVRFSSGMTITASYVVLATGFAMAVPKIPLLDTLASRLALPVCEGFPVLTDDCTWQPTDNIQAPAKDGNITVVGALAAGSLGPCAFNLLGVMMLFVQYYSLPLEDDEDAF